MSTRREFIQGSAATLAVMASPESEAKRKKHTGPITLAIVGAGQAAVRRYIGPGSKNPRVRLVAACARRLEEAKARTIEYGIGAWYDDYNVMYETVKPDAVIIATPTTVHAAPAIAAMERGIHVLCEKPMASAFEDCLAMVAAAEKNGVVYLNLPYDATPSFLTALDYLNEATLGVLTGAEANLSLPGVSRDNWYYDIKIAGGGAGLDTLVYPVSKLISLLGPARRVTGFVNTLIPTRILGDGATIDTSPPPRDPNQGKIVKPTVDDNVTLLIEWPTGQQATARALWGTSFVTNTAAIYVRHGTLWTSIFGGDVILHSPERSIVGAEQVTWNGQTSCYKVPIRDDRKNKNDEGLIDHFVDCIEGLTKPTCSGQQQLHVHEILFKGYEAARTGRTQELTTSFTPWHSIDPAFVDTRSRPI